MLQKQRLDIPFIRGLNSEIDPKVLPPGEFVTAQNVVVDKSGGFVGTRATDVYSVNQTVKLQDSTFDTTSSYLVSTELGGIACKVVNTAKDFLMLKSAGAVAQAQSAQYQYVDPTWKGWRNLYPFSAQTVKTENVVGAPLFAGSAARNPYSASDGIHTVTVENEFYQVTETKSGKLIYRNSLVYGINSIYGPTVITGLGVFYHFAGGGTGGEFLIAVADSTAPGATRIYRYAVASNVFTYINSTTGATLLDTTIVITGSTKHGLTLSSGGGHLYIDMWGTTRETSLDLGVIAVSGSACFIPHTANIVYVTAAGVYYAGATATAPIGGGVLTLDVAAMQVHASVTATRAIGLSQGHEAKYLIIFELDSGALNGRTLWYDLVSAAGAITAGVQFLATAGITSQAFNYAAPVHSVPSVAMDSPAYMWIHYSYPTSTQGAFFLLEIPLLGSSAHATSTEAPRIVARVPCGSQFTWPTRIAHVEWSSTQAQAALVRLGDTENPEYGAGSARTGESILVTSYKNTLALPGLNRQNNFYFGGGLIWSYDGLFLAENQPHLYPEGNSAADGAGAGALTGGGTYQYCTVYKFIDANGNTIRSAPSPITTHTTGGAATSIDLTLQPLRLSTYADNRGTNAQRQLYTEIYRTTNGGTLFYLVATIGGTAIAYSDLIADATIISNALLYTEGGALENISAPNPKSVCEYGDRVWLASDDNILWYSKSITIYEGVVFSDLLYFPVSKELGEIKFICPVGDSLGVFCERGVWKLNGSPANDVGLDATLFIELASRDFGVGPISTILPFKEGAVFGTLSGIVFVDAGWNFTPLNEPRDYAASALSDAYLGTSYGVKDSALAEGTNELLFLTTNNQILRFNYKVGIWTTQIHKYTSTSTYLSVSSTRGMPCYLCTEFKTVGGLLSNYDILYTEQLGVTALGNSSHDMVLKTGWLRPAGIEGFARLYNIYILGEYRSSSTLTAKINYPDGTSDSQIFTLAATTEPFNLRVKPSKQKQAAYQIEITVTTSGGGGSACKLFGLSLEYGVKSKLTTKSTNYK